MNEMFNDIPKGWQCPVCGVVYSPSVLKCWNDHGRMSGTAPTSPPLPLPPVPDLPNTQRSGDPYNVSVTVKSNEFSGGYVPPGKINFVRQWGDNDPYTLHIMTVTTPRGASSTTHRRMSGIQMNKVAKD